MFELALTKNDPQYVMQPEPVRNFHLHEAR